MTTRRYDRELDVALTAAREAATLFREEFHRPSARAMTLNP